MVVVQLNKYFFKSNDILNCILSILVLYVRVTFHPYVVILPRYSAELDFAQLNIFTFITLGGCC